MSKQFCPKGHDTKIVGRYYSHCKECVKVFQKKYRAEHKDKIIKISRRYEKSHKEKIADSKLRSKYGISLYDKLCLFRKQNGLCAICSFTFESMSSAHVDHSHTTQKVRGLLCSSCNLMLGKSKDNIEILQKAIEYLF